jgi:hypothetical protein
MKKTTVVMAAFLLLVAAALATWDVHGSRRILALAKLAKISGTEFTQGELDALEAAYPALAKMADHDVVVDRFWELIRDEESEKIDWEQAKKLILAGKIKSVSQSHSLEIYMIGLNGQVYLSKEDRIDEVRHLIGQVDPKSVFVKYMTE